MADLQFHPAAEIFPLLDGKELDALADDIAENGLQIPVEILDEKIIDGRNRYRACLMRGVEPDIVEVEADDPVAYVLSMNLHRRHLTPSQLSMVAARAREFYDKQAKGRQKRKPKSVPENLPEQKGDARDKAGKAVGVSGKTVDHASRVLEKGTPELVKAVDEGRIAVSTAAVLATEPQEKQREEVARPKRRRVYTPETGKRKEKTGGNSTEKLIKTITGDIDRLVGRIKRVQKGLKAQRERAVTNLRLAKKYVSAATDFFN